MASVTLDYTMRVRVDPAGAVLTPWARLRLAASILMGRPVLIDIGPTDTDDTDDDTDTQEPPR